MSYKKVKKKKKKIRKKNKRIYSLLFFLGIISFALQVTFYRKTIIDIEILLLMIMVSGIIGSYFDYSRFVFTYEFNRLWSYIFSFFQNAIFLGGIVGLLFLTVNYYFPDSKIEKEEYSIIDRSSASGGKYHRSERRPLFTINYRGEEKELVYNHSYYAEMNEYKSVVIETKKGFFGFDIILDRKLNK